MSAKLQDIANATGASVSTVSRVLAGGAASRRVSLATRERVLAAARRLGYRPNLLARSLRTRRSHTVALLVSDISNPFFGAIAAMVERQLHQHGYTLMLCNSEEDPELEREYLRLMAQKGIDGLIVVPLAESVEQLTEALPEDLPLVVLDRPVCGHRHSVSTDNEKMTGLLCDVLSGAGVTAVGLISGPGAVVTHRRRAEIIRERFTVTHVVEGPPRMETGRGALIEFLGERPRAIICTNNLLGQGLLDAMASIEQPPIVACFDEIPMMQLLPAPLVVCLQDIAALADGCVRMLLPLLGDPPTTAPEPIVLEARAITNPAFQAMARTGQPR